VAVLRTDFRAGRNAKRDIAKLDLVFHLVPNLLNRLRVGVANRMHHILVRTTKRDATVVSYKEVLGRCAASRDLIRVEAVILTRGRHYAGFYDGELNPRVIAEGFAEEDDIGPGESLRLVIHQSDRDVEARRRHRNQVLDVADDLLELSAPRRL